MDSRSDLIAAKATPETVSAMGVVRLSGPGASVLVEKIMGLSPGRLQGMRRSVGDFDGIDHLVAISWPRGRSYTGEEMVDLMCHGSSGTASAVLNRLLKAGARQADPGEFTRRAWLNGRLTEIDVLALSARFRNINTGDALELKKKLSRIVMETEALIEFEEEHGIEPEYGVKKLLVEAREAASLAEESVGRIEVLPCVYIMGPVNSGKSTLFNLLSRETAAIVSDIPGTTRDGAERTVDISGRLVRLRDTAGTGGDELDGCGLEISVAAMRRGDRILWLDPFMKEPPSNIVKDHSVMKMASLCDKGTKEIPPGWYRLSSTEGIGLDRVEEFITAPEKGSPSSRLGRVKEMLGEALASWEDEDIALAAEILRMVTDEMNSTEKGSDAVERALNVFCVGK